MIWGQLTLSEGMGSTIEILNYFHDYMIIILLFILVFVTYLFLAILATPLLDNYTFDSHSLETFWTIFPMVILLFMAFPSLYLLYLIEETSSPALSVKVVGHQNCCEYQHSNLWFSCSAVLQGWIKSLAFNFLNSNFFLNSEVYILVYPNGSVSIIEISFISFMEADDSNGLTIHVPDNSPNTSYHSPNDCPTNYETDGAIPVHLVREYGSSIANAPISMGDTYSDPLDEQIQTVADFFRSSNNSLMPQILVGLVKDHLFSTGGVIMPSHQGMYAHALDAGQLHDQILPRGEVVTEEWVVSEGCHPDSGNSSDSQTSLSDNNEENSVIDK